MDNCSCLTQQRRQQSTATTPHSEAWMGVLMVMFLVSILASAQLIAMKMARNEEILGLDVAPAILSNFFFI
jgi:hypothetical protein